MEKSVVALCVFVLFSGTPPLPAQWHGDGTQISESCLKLTGLPYMPELHTDMPLDCFIGYVAMDSISRTIGVFEATRYPQNAIIPQLRIVSRYMYAMADYDPILLMRHFVSSRDSTYPNANYQSYPANSYFPVLMEIYKRQEAFGKHYGMLIGAAYVLHVRVTDVRQGIDSTMYGHDRENINVACEVVEVFKGHKLPNNCAPQQNTSKRGHEKPLAQSTCLIYGSSPDSKAKMPQVGDEMIIFLDLVVEKKNIFSIRPNGSFNKTMCGRFLVRNGRVEDPDNVWGLGTTPTLETFRSTLLQHISDIYSWKP